MPILEHPDITRCLLTGYPYPVREELDEDEIWEELPEYDEDLAFEERREELWEI